MGKIVTAVLALAAISSMAYYVMYRPAKDSRIDTEATSAPKQQLDNVRAKAKQIERQQEQHLTHVEERVNNDSAPAPADP